jgi:3-dehydroquinate synthase
MIHINTQDYLVSIGSFSESNLGSILEAYSAAKKIILVDENTHDCCLEALITTFDDLADAEVMLLPSGEENKVMEVCFQVWEAWSEYKVSRHDLVLNLGGGVVTDMGGFMASIFKRGLNFVNIPTSLLSMVDASVGGKTGIDLGVYKNQLGLFVNPLAVIVDPGFLNTLPVEEKWSGLAEMLKHGLIASKAHWDIVKFIDASEDVFGAEIIAASIEIKRTIVEADFHEKNIRKKLNFGHTIGHALEGYLLFSAKISHGHAVALGMMLEAQLSVEKGLLSSTENEEIQTYLSKNYPKVQFQASELPAIFELMKNDKKNRNQEIQSVLLSKIGEAVIDQVVHFEEIEKVFHTLNFIQED